jgi:hypothetical protein
MRQEPKPGREIMELGNFSVSAQPHFDLELAFPVKKMKEA